jgi:hypothetical protein
MEQRAYWKKLSVALGIVFLMPFVLMHLWDLLDLFRGQNQLLSYLKSSFLFNSFAIMKFGVMATLFYAAMIFGSKVHDDQLGASLILGSALSVGWFCYAGSQDVFQQDIALFGALIVLIGISIGLGEEGV